MRALLIPFAGALALLFGTSTVRAEETVDADRAAALAHQGRQFMDAQDYASACPKLAESQMLDPSSDTEMDLNTCYRRLWQQQPRAAASKTSRPTNDELLRPAERSSQGQTQRGIGLGIAGVGVAGVIAGVVTLMVGRSELQRSITACSAPNLDCTDSASLRHAGNELTVVSTTSLIAGAVAAATGAYVFLTTPKSSAAALAIAVSPLGRSGGTVGVAGHF